MGLELNSVNFSYLPETPVLKNVSFHVGSGELVLILGRNGAGKSTLLKLLNGILKPTQGRILVDGLDTSLTSTAKLAKSIAVTFQNPGDQIFASSVRGEIEFGPRNLGQPDLARVLESTMDLFLLTQYEKKHPYDLLPAQRKLLSIASSVAMLTRAVAFDEPTAGLSQRERLIFGDVLQKLKADGRTLLIVSHDLEFFLPLVSRVILMREGEVIFDGESTKLIADDTPLRHCGTRLPTPIRLKKILEEVR